MFVGRRYLQSSLTRYFSMTTSLSNAASPLSTLRKKTGYSLSHCRTALQQFNDNLEQVKISTRLDSTRTKRKFIFFPLGRSMASSTSTSRRLESSDEITKSSSITRSRWYCKRSKCCCNCRSKMNSNHRYLFIVNFRSIVKQILLRKMKNFNN